MRDLHRLSPHDLEEARRRFLGDGVPPISKSANERVRRVLGETQAFEFERLKGTPSKITLADSGLDSVTGQDALYVKWVQESLNSTIGSGLGLSGVLTQQTSAAVREFQRRNGLVPDGIVGPKTEAKLIEVTKTHPPGRSLEASLRLNFLDKPNPFDYFLKNLEAARVQPSPSEVSRRMVFLDVKKGWGGRISVVAHTGTDFWFQEAGLSEFSHPTTRYVSSVADLEQLIGDSTTVIHRGDDLPTEWQERLQANREYLRASNRSPKETLGEHRAAAELLDHHAEVGKTRILSALPQARERNDLVRELARMGLQTNEAEIWQDLHENLDALKGQSSFQIEAATKKAFIEELRNGENDDIMLIAHFADGKLHFPGGETMTTDELAAVQRKQAPQRAVIFVSCSAGIVNERRISPSEIVLRGNMAQVVVAHPDPISALQVPDLLRKFLTEGKKIREVFMGHGYQFITEYLWLEPLRFDTVSEGSPVQTAKLF
jgi:hypothetical protein